MKSLDDLSLRARIIILLAIIIGAFLLIYFVGSFTQGVESGESEQIYQGVPIDSRLLQLDKEALELAYKEHLKLLFSVWLKDGVSTVDRINNGLRNSRKAYGLAAEQIEKRERMQRPSPR